MLRNGRNSCLVQPAPGWIPEIWRCPEEDLSYPDTLRILRFGQKNETGGQLLASKLLASLVSAWSFSHQAPAQVPKPTNKKRLLEIWKNWISVNTGKKKTAHRPDHLTGACCSLMGSSIVCSHWTPHTTQANNQRTLSFQKLCESSYDVHWLYDVWLYFPISQRKWSQFMIYDVGKCPLLPLVTPRSVIITGDCWWLKSSTCWDKWNPEILCINWCRISLINGTGSKTRCRNLYPKYVTQTNKYIYIYIFLYM